MKIHLSRGAEKDGLSGRKNCTMTSTLDLIGFACRIMSITQLGKRKFHYPITTVSGQVQHEAKDSKNSNLPPEERREVCRCNFLETKQLIGFYCKGMEKRINEPRNFYTVARRLKYDSDMKCTTSECC